jgi:predicted RNase H-like HicB family nuclease
MTKHYDVIVERDSEGFLVGSVPAIPGCHTQARSLDELMLRMREAIEFFLEVGGETRAGLEFVGLQRLAVEQ